MTKKNLFPFFFRLVSLVLLGTLSRESLFAMPEADIRHAYDKAKVKIVVRENSGDRAETASGYGVVFNARGDILAPKYLFTQNNDQILEVSVPVDTGGPYYDPPIIGTNLDYAILSFDRPCFPSRTPLKPRDAKDALEVGEPLYAIAKPPEGKKTRTILMAGKLAELLSGGQHAVYRGDGNENVQSGSVLLDAEARVIGMRDSALMEKNFIFSLFDAETTLAYRDEKQRGDIGQAGGSPERFGLRGSLKHRLDYDFDIRPDAFRNPKVVFAWPPGPSFERVEYIPSLDVFWGVRQNEITIVDHKARSAKTYTIPRFRDICYSPYRHRFAAIDEKEGSAIEYDRDFKPLPPYRVSGWRRLIGIRPFSETKYLGWDEAGGGYLELNGRNANCLFFQNAYTFKVLRSLESDKSYIAISETSKNGLALVEVVVIGKIHSLNRGYYKDCFSRDPADYVCLKDAGLFWANGYMLDVGNARVPYFKSEDRLLALSDDGRLGLKVPKTAPDDKKVFLVRTRDGEAFAEIPPLPGTLGGATGRRAAGFFPGKTGFWIYGENGVLAFYEFGDDVRKTPSTAKMADEGEALDRFVVAPLSRREAKK